MNEEEIENRIHICEEREKCYREVGKTRIANKYEKEKYKWEKLLSKLDSKRDEELRDYKKGYTNLKQALTEIREHINKNCDFNGTALYDKWIPGRDILQIIDKHLGDEK